MYEMRCRNRRNKEKYMGGGKGAEERRVNIWEEVKEQEKEGKIYGRR
jgi:hypothetical protein